MKLIIVLSITEYQERVSKLLHEAGVNRFSVMSMTGFKKSKEHVALNWFGSDSPKAKTNSILLFSFAPEDIARNVIQSIDKCNDETRNPYPVHAFILDVGNYSGIFS